MNTLKRLLRKFPCLVGMHAWVVPPDSNPQLHCAYCGKR